MSLGKILVTGILGILFVIAVGSFPTVAVMLTALSITALFLIFKTEY